MELSVSVGGSGPLLKGTVLPFPRENLAVRSTAIRCVNPGTGQVELYTGPRLRTKHLLVPPSTASRQYQAAVKDSNAMWSEWSPVQNAATAHFVGASTNNVSIGSGSADDLSLEEPAVRFPSLNLGSSRHAIYRTVVSEGFYDEVRRVRWRVNRAAFHCIFTDLDEQESLLLHRFYRALNGPLTPFFFDWTDPDTKEEQRYTVRFRDPGMADELFGFNDASMDFTLVELIGTVDGSAV